jgi:Bacterial Ig-like domain
MFAGGAGIALVGLALSAAIALAAPTVTITSGPAAGSTTNNPEPVFGFTAADFASVSCAVAPGAEIPTPELFSDCSSTSSHSLGPLDDGQHTFAVRATDEAMDTALDFRTFTVDATAPGITIDSGPTDPTSDSQPTFEFTAEAGANVACSFDQGTPAFGPCDSTANDSPAAPLADGEWTFRVRATDVVGNSDTAVEVFTVDTTPPDTNILSGPAHGSISNDNDPSFSFDGSGDTEHFDCRLTTGTFSECTSPRNFTNLADGTYTFEVFAVDAAGNEDLSPASREFTIDTAPPALSIDSGPSGPTGNASPVFGFTPEAGATLECSVDQGSADFDPCTTGTTHSEGPLADGNWTFRVRATDAASNTTTVTRSFAVDATLPTITIDTGPLGPTSDPSPSFGFTPEAGTTVACSVDQGTEAFGPCTTGTTHNAGTLAEGAWNFRVRVTDGVNNTATEMRSFTVDTTGPAVTVNGPKRTGQRKPTFELSSPEVGATFRCKLDSRPAVPCDAAFTPAGKLKPGSHKLVATALDALENSGQSKTFRFKILRPALKPGRAGSTVAKALRSHGFANRVVANLDENCSRASRYKFTCRFSSTFGGYRLKGSGPVKLGKNGLSYRFKVRAQGQRMTLTDENAGRVRAPA